VVDDMLVGGAFNVVATGSGTPLKTQAVRVKGLVLSQGASSARKRGIVNHFLVDGAAQETATRGIITARVVARGVELVGRARDWRGRESTDRQNTSVFSFLLLPPSNRTDPRDIIGM
jgi:hypothetical protein